MWALKSSGASARAAILHSARPRGRRTATFQRPPALPSPASRRAAPFLLGLFIGCLIGAAALLGGAAAGRAPLPGGGIEQTAAFQAVRAQQTEADNQARESEAGRQAAESAPPTGAEASRVGVRPSAPCLPLSCRRSRAA